MKKKVVFMGTPIFATAILESLLKLEEVEVIGVVSQPDKKVGRKQVLTPTPVKALAQTCNIDVFQPISIKSDYQQIIDWNPDLVVTCAYGQIVPKEVLYAFEFPCINVHASLLPKYRGGAPIHKAIIEGERETGITLMQMVEKMDAGQMYAKEVVAISIDDTMATLHDKLMLAGSKLINEQLPKFLTNQLVGEAQDERLVSFARNISKDEELIDPRQDVLKVYNHIRGLISWPVGYIIVNDKKIKLHEVALTHQKIKATPGELIQHSHCLYLCCENGLIEIKQLQLEGKSRTTAQDFINGAKNYIANTN